MNPWATPQAYNNMKDFFETGVSWSNNVNVAQRFDKGNYSFSLGNTTSNGIVPSTGMDRYNVKMSAEAQLHPNWTTGFNGNFVTSKISKQSTANTSVVATIYNAPVSYNMAGIPSHIEATLTHKIHIETAGSTMHIGQLTITSSPNVHNVSSEMLS